MAHTRIKWLKKQAEAQKQSAKKVKREKKDEKDK